MRGAYGPLPGPISATVDRSLAKQVFARSRRHTVTSMHRSAGHDPVSREYCWTGKNASRLLWPMGAFIRRPAEYRCESLHPWRLRPDSHLDEGHTFGNVGPIPAGDQVGQDSRLKTQFIPLQGPLGHLLEEVLEVEELPGVVTDRVRPCG